MPWRKTLRPLPPLRWPSRCIIITITCTTWLPRPRRLRLLPNKQNCGAASAFRAYAKLQTLRINLCPESFFRQTEPARQRLRIGARFAFGWNRFGSFSAAGRDVGPVDPFWVFLAPSHFAAKTPADECWIVLDFLGFSRPNLDFSMGYEDFSGKNFSLSLSAGGDAGTGTCGLSLRKGRIVHGASLIHFLIFCKRLPPPPPPLGRLNPKATRS